MSLTAVALNDGNHYETHRTLYEYGFENYKKYKILDKKRFKIDDKFYKEKIYIKDDFYYPLTDVEKDKVKVLVKIMKLENYKNNDEVGMVEVYLNDDIIFNEPIYVMVDYKESFIDKIKKIFKD